MTVARNDAALTRWQLNYFTGLNEMLELLLGPLMRNGRLSRSRELLLEPLDRVLLISLHLPIQLARVACSGYLGLGSTTLTAWAQAVICTSSILCDKSGQLDWILGGKKKTWRFHWTDVGPAKQSGQSTED